MTTPRHSNAIMSHLPKDHAAAICASRACMLPLLKRIDGRSASDDWSRRLAPQNRTEGQDCSSPSLAAADIGALHPAPDPADGVLD